MQIPVCEILGVRIAAVNMETLLHWIGENLPHLSGQYVCVANVHTTVTAFEEADYLAVQNGAAITIPDGAPLALVGRKRGFSQMRRTPGPDVMQALFRISREKGYRHYFYGATPDTLQKLRARITADFPGLVIAGMESPPFRPLTPQEDAAAVGRICEAKPDFVWVALGAPRQERWMAAHQGKVPGLMVGVGAAFDFAAGNIRRAPRWMQKCCLEWLWRLLQDPRRLLGRYLRTNTRFLWLMARGK